MDQIDSKARRSGKTSCSDQEFIERYEAIGPTKLAKEIGIATRNVMERRLKIERAQGITIVAPKPNREPRLYEPDYPARLPLTIYSGSVLVGSDAHVWPGITTTARRAFVKFAKDIDDLVTVVLNGDTFDGAKTGRHPAIGWEPRPEPADELIAVEEFTDEIRLAAKGAELYWMMGNHCARFENMLANQAPAYRGVQGFKLKDHFPHWKFGMSLWVNNDAVIKHRFKGGIHATHNNALYAGRTIITGHLHSLKVTPFTDYNGTRWGVDTGTLGDIDGPHTRYDEDNPKNHRSGFALLTFHGGKLLTPELIRVVDDLHVEFRGRIIAV